MSWCKAENRVPLGFVEGLNSRMRKIQARGYGYTAMEHMDHKILTCMLPDSQPLTIDLGEFFGPSKRAIKPKKT